MLQIENEYETPIESNYYQKHCNNFQNADNIQEIIDYTKQELKRSSSTNNIYQNTSNKTQLPNEKIWTIPLLLETPKRFSITRPRNWFFKRLRSRIKYNKCSQLERDTFLHPKLKPSKTSCKLATAQESSLTNFEKSNCSFFPLE